MRSFIDIVTQTKPAKRLDEVFDIGTPKFAFISQFIAEDERDQSAAGWGRELGLGNSLFKDIPVGGKFRFGNSDEVLTKVSSTQYRSPNSPSRFRTGARTAVSQVGGEVEETTWHQDRRPIDPSDKNGKWNVYDNPPGGHASIMQFSSEADAEAYVARRKRLGSGDHCRVVPPKDMRESSLLAIGMGESFEKVAGEIERKEGVSKDAAGAILANATRHASKKAKAENPKLKKVK